MKASFEIIGCYLPLLIPSHEKALFFQSLDMLLYMFVQVLSLRTYVNYLTGKQVVKVIFSWTYYICAMSLQKVDLHMYVCIYVAFLGLLQTDRGMLYC